MPGYEVLKFAHVLSVIAWVGGGIGFFVLQARFAASGDRGGLMSFGRQMETMGKTYFGPLAAATLVTGIWMVATTDGIAFGDAWVLIGLGGIALTMGVAFGGITPTGHKLMEESQKPEPDGAVLGALYGRMRALTATNLAILVIVVWAMVTHVGA